MFERYTEGARRVLFFARYEASQFGSRSIESEHLLLGLIRHGKDLTSRIFAQFNLSLDSIRKEIEGRFAFREKVSTSVEMPFSDESMRILQFAAEESDRLLHNYIGTEHLLLGILREERSLAGTILTEKGLRLNAVRQELVTLLNEHPSLGMDVTVSVAEPLKRLVEENAQLRAVIRELEKKHQSPLEFRDNAYWLQREGQTPEGPYCSTCWDIDRRLVRKLRAADGGFYCEYCTHHRPSSEPI